MNDSPGWASPGSSPSEGEGGQAGGTGGQGAPEGIQPPAQPAADSKWSAAQPPPGQWAGPGGPTPDAAPADAAPQQPQQGAGWGSYGPPTGQPGQPQHYGSPYGGQYGHPGGPWGPPPAAKPGVIPLRPLGLGELLDGAVSTMRTHWRSVLSISLVVAVLIEAGNVLINKFALADLTAASATGDDPEQVLRGFRDAVVPVLANGFLQLVLGITASALLTVIYSRAVIGRPVTVGEAWREARPRLLPLAGLTALLAVGSVLLLGVLILPGLLMENIGVALLGVLVAMPLFVWLWFRFVLASPALMLERAGVLTALRRSAKLVRGAWWRVFGITLLTGLITGLVSMLITMPFTLVAVLSGVGDLSSFTDGSFAVSWSFLLINGIGSIISFTVVLPISAGITVLLYIDQRIRREALDLELARAAGLQDHGSAGAGYGG